MLFLLYPCFFYGQADRKYSLKIFEEKLAGELEKFFYYPDVNRNLQFVFVVGNYGNTANLNDRGINKFIVSLIRKTAEKKNLRYSFAKNADSVSNDSVYYIVKMDEIILETKYPGFKKNRFLGEKTLVRKITGNITVDMHSNDGKFSHKDKVLLDYTDEIDYDTYESYESLEYDFTKAKPPKTGAFESLIFPVLLVTASAAATILFFIIRSK
jgi:hypothetical protein